jgi:hypothetical protein
MKAPALFQLLVVGGIVMGTASCAGGTIAPSTSTSRPAQTSRADGGVNPDGGDATDPGPTDTGGGVQGW